MSQKTFVYDHFISYLSFTTSLRLLELALSRSHLIQNRSDVSPQLTWGTFRRCLLRHQRFILRSIACQRAFGTLGFPFRSLPRFQTNETETGKGFCLELLPPCSQGLQTVIGWCFHVSSALIWCSSEECPIEKISRLVTACGYEAQCHDGKVQANKCEVPMESERGRETRESRWTLMIRRVSKFAAV